VPSITRADGYEISTDPARIDLDLVHRWLSPAGSGPRAGARAPVARAAEGSLVFGAFAPKGRQVGVARVVTDGATFAWLCDVYVDRTQRGRGLGSWLVAVVLDDLRARGVPRIMLATADAHGVYVRHGFAALAEPGRWMELTGP
jgi:GNAT superfamily N-acetyltransferase